MRKNIVILTESLCHDQLVSVLIKELKVLGIEASGYKSYSFRIGAASLAAAQNISNEEIMNAYRRLFCDVLIKKLQRTYFCACLIDIYINTFSSDNFLND
jgi:hypothetical protein